jgi:hypothetical protein
MTLPCAATKSSLDEEIAAWVASTYGAKMAARRIGRILSRLGFFRSLSRAACGSRMTSRSDLFGSFARRAHYRAGFRVDAGPE